MTSGEFDIQQATTLPAPPATGEARPGAWLPPKPQAEDASSVSSTSAPASVSMVRPGLTTWLARLWGARGLFGGVLAILIAWSGQNALLTLNDYQTSTRNYIIAIIILVSSFLHPTLPNFLKRKKDVAATTEVVAGGAPPVEPGANGQQSVALPADAVQLASAPPVSMEMERISTLPVRPLRTRAGGPITRPLNDNDSDFGDVSATVATNGHIAEVLPAQTSPIAIAVSTSVTKGSLWSRYSELRARLGWRVTSPGLALTLILGGVSFFVLYREVTSPLGGWLWAAALAVLLLTFLGAPGWPRGDGLLTSPWGDWFAPGVPRIPWKVETALVFGLMAMAIFLRVWNLDYHPGIFGDEGERGMDARAIFEGRPANLFSYGWWGVPNMYFYLTAAMFHVFGDNLIGDRMLSVISGVVAVWFVYKSARLLWGPRAGLIAGVMMAVSPLALQFSRLAGESTPTGALWAVGAYYLLLALRDRKWSDWILAGFFWAFNLYFYASGKMVIPLAGVAAIYALVRWRKEFFKRYFLGFALMGLAFGLTFLPYLVTSIQDGWLGFMGRANETSIFSPQNQASVFARYGLQYDPTWGGLSLVENFRTNPVAWSGLVYQQARETLDGVYKRGDQVPFYNVPGLVSLAPFWAVLGMLGLAYALWKFWDARYALAMLWFVVGMAASFLTIDTPNYQRYTNAWPAMMLFPAALLDRVLAAGWPLSISFARKWSAIPLVGLLLFLGADSYREYFVFYPTTCPYCLSTAQARYAEKLGQDYKGYQMGVGGYDVYFSYGPTRFLAKGVEGVDMIAVADDLPVIDNNGKGLAFLIYGNNAEYIPLVKLFYPMALVEEIKGSAGNETQFTSIKVTKEQIASTQTLHAIYKLASGAAVERDEANAGISSKAKLPEGLAFPVQAEWKGGLVAPQYGIYQLSLAGATGAAKLELDGRTILEQTSGGKASAVEMALARGIHDIKLTATLADAQNKVQVMWASGGGQLAPISAKYLYNGLTGGLSGEIGHLATSAQDAQKAQDPFSGQPPTERRSDPFIGFRQTNLFGMEGFLARWQGTLNLPTEGDYGFMFGAGAQGVIMVDGKSVFGVGPDGGGGNGGPTHLAAGAHTFEARYGSQGGTARIEVLWTRPGAQPEIIPTTYLQPLKRSWTKEELPNAPQPNLPPPTLSDAPLKQPELVLGGGDLAHPRGVAVDKDGNIYVGDRGNHRVVVYTPDGKVARTWGKAAPQVKPGEAAPAFQAGEFGDILDVGVGEDGTVYVADDASRVQAFTQQGEFKGSYEPGQLSLYGPNGIGVGSKGVYIAVTGQNKVLRAPPIDDVKNGTAKLPDSMESIVAAGSAGGATDSFEQPVDVAIDPTGSGLLYALDLRDRIVQLTAPADAGKPWTISKQWALPVGLNEGGSRIAVSPDGNKIYTSDPDRHRVSLLDLTTGEMSFFGSEGADPGKFGMPGGIAIGPDGKVYVVDSANGNVQVFGADK